MTAFNDFMIDGDNCLPSYFVCIALATASGLTPIAHHDHSSRSHLSTFVTWRPSFHDLRKTIGVSLTDVARTTPSQISPKISIASLLFWAK